MRHYIPFVFITAGLFNILGILTISHGFQNTHVSTLFPEVFSTFGMICIMLWGGAYISVSTEYPKVPRILFIFFVEKMLYAGSAVYFWFVLQPDFYSMWDASPLTTLFYASYGIGDFLFGLFFFIMWIKNRK
jgi:hypothetical protein